MIAPTFPAINLPAPAPVASPAPPGPESDGAAPERFARLLDRASQQRADTAASAAPAAADDDKTPGKPAVRSAGAKANLPKPGTSKTGAGATAPSPRPGGPAAPDHAPAPDSETATPAAAPQAAAPCTDATAAAAASLNNPAGLLQPRPAAAPPADDPRGLGPAPAAEAREKAVDAAAALGADVAARAARPLAGERAQTVTPGLPGAASGLAANPAGQMAADTVSLNPDNRSERPSGPQLPAVDCEFPAAAPLPAPAPAPGPAAPAAVVQAKLEATPGSAEFATQLGAQLSTFVRDGVQHARLELHPADMGPLTVQIQLDGVQAQVHLAAENAETRQALEQAMPQLAGSLREGGLTLSGGGVFEQPRQRDQRPGGPVSATPGGGERDRGGSLVPLPAAPLARSRGVVDLVA